jgi:methionine-rich copper-binding protein CopC
LTFSEGVEPQFSGIELAADDGRTITTGAAVIDPGDDKRAAPYWRCPAPAGRYRVSWHVVSVDTHRTEVRTALRSGRERRGWMKCSTPAASSTSRRRW